MRGNITRRGKSSWRIKFDVCYDATTGKRKYHVEMVRGSKADAVTLLSKRLAERGEGQLVERTTITVAAYGLSPQTVRHIHRLLSQILASAVKAQKLRHSPVLTVQAAPSVPRPQDRSPYARRAGHVAGPSEGAAALHAGAARGFHRPQAR